MSKEILMDAESREVNELLDIYNEQFSIENFKDKTIVLTGGAKGIGFNIARGLLHLGAKISIIDKLEVKSIAGIPVDYYPCELASNSDLKSTIEKILKTNDKIDGLINCAAEFSMFTIRDFNPELMRKKLASNSLVYPAMMTIRFCFLSLKASHKVSTHSLE